MSAPDCLRAPALKIKRTIPDWASSALFIALGLGWLQDRPMRAAQIYAPTHLPSVSVPFDTQFPSLHLPLDRQHQHVNNDSH